jgi:hypothetical protein
MCFSTARRGLVSDDTTAGKALSGLRRVEEAGVLPDQVNTFLKAPIEARPHSVPVGIIRHRWECCPQLVNLFTKGHKVLLSVVHEFPTLSVMG